MLISRVILVPSGRVAVPMNFYIIGDGSSYSNVTGGGENWGPKIAKKFVGVYFYFRFVSPSKFLVSMRQVPFTSPVFKIIISAGKYASFNVLKISPTHTSLHKISTNCPFLYTNVLLLFS